MESAFSDFIPLYCEQQESIPPIVTELVQIRQLTSLDDTKDSSVSSNFEHIMAYVYAIFDKNTYVV